MNHLGLANKRLAACLAGLISVLLMVTSTVVIAVEPAFHSLSHWRQLYGDALLFDVTRDGRPAGSYRVSFSGSDASWQVESRMDLDFKALLFFSYRFRYLGVEQWHYDRMQQFTSRINRNGSLSETFLQRAQNRDGVTFWRGGLRQAKAAEAATESVQSIAEGLRHLALSNHYNRGIVQQTLLFNSLSGQLNRIQMVYEAQESISDGRTLQPASRYRYSGDLQDTWVWYADDGRWLGMRFIADDGSTIQLHCRQCYALQESF